MVHIEVVFRISCFHFLLTCRPLISYSLDESKQMATHVPIPSIPPSVVSSYTTQATLPPATTASAQFDPMHFMNAMGAAHSYPSFPAAPAPVAPAPQFDPMNFMRAAMMPAVARSHPAQAPPAPAPHFDPMNFMHAMSAAMMPAAARSYPPPYPSFPAPAPPVPAPHFDPMNFMHAMSAAMMPAAARSSSYPSDPISSALEEDDSKPAARQD
jgi:hypothetical protein